MRRVAPSTITVADLLMRGVDEMDASCLRCGENWQAPIGFLPPATTLAKISELMVCPACDGWEVEVAPAWPGDAPKIN